MARTPYPDPDAEDSYQEIQNQSSKPSGYEGNGEFESSMLVGGYEMPRAGKASDYTPKKKK